MSLKTTRCPVCQAVVNVDPDGTMWEHGQVEHGRFVPCVLSGKKPVLRPTGEKTHG